MLYCLNRRLSSDRPSRMKVANLSMKMTMTMMMNRVYHSVSVWSSMVDDLDWQRGRMRLDGRNYRKMLLMYRRFVPFFSLMVKKILNR